MPGMSVNRMLTAEERERLKHLEMEAEGAEEQAKKEAEEAARQAAEAERRAQEADYFKEREQELAQALSLS